MKTKRLNSYFCAHILRLTGCANWVCPEHRLGDVLQSSDHSPSVTVALYSDPHCLPVSYWTEPVSYASGTIAPPIATLAQLLRTLAPALNSIKVVTHVTGCVDFFLSVPLMARQAPPLHKRKRNCVPSARIADANNNEATSADQQHALASTRGF
jgi:hypothetical protein